MFGSTVNICAKINSSAPLNGLIIGGDLFQIVKGYHESSPTSFIIKKMGSYSTEGSRTHSYPLYSVTSLSKLAIPTILVLPESGIKRQTLAGQSLEKGAQKFNVMLMMTSLI